MSKKCKKCNTKIMSDNYKYCPTCGYNIKEKKNITVIAIITIIIIIIIIIVLDTLVGKTILKATDLKEIYLNKYIIPNIKKIYDGYTIKGTFIEKKECNFTESLTIGPGDTREWNHKADVYHYNVQITDDRYPESIISSSVYLRSDNKFVYDTELIWLLSKNNIEYYLQSDTLFKNPTVEISSTSNKSTTDICDLSYKKDYTVKIKLDTLFKENIDSSSFRKTIDAINYISNNILDIFPSTIVDYYIIYNDGYIIKPNKKVNPNVVHPNLVNIYYNNYVNNYEIDLTKSNDIIDWCIKNEKDSYKYIP